MELKNAKPKTIAGKASNTSSKVDFLRFTDRARKSLSLANLAAQSKKHEVVGVQDLLYGILAEGNNVAANVLRDVCPELQKLMGYEKYTMAGVNEFARLDRSPLLDELLFAAVDFSKTTNCGFVGSEHILLAIMHSAMEPNSVLHTWAAQLEIPCDEVYEELHRILGTPLMPDLSNTHLVINNTVFRLKLTTNSISDEQFALKIRDKNYKLETVIS